MEPSVQLIECPRDAMQGWPVWIPTELKIQYLEALLKVGFDTIDCGSFVSPKAIPQMRDTAEVLGQVNRQGSQTSLLVIVANLRGATEAVSFDPVRYLGFPFSVSPTFQIRNTNSTPEESLERVADIQKLCEENGKELVVYLSMGFGNPYGDPYNEEIVMDWARKMSGLGVRIFSLADTVGLATAEQVGRVTRALILALPGKRIGVHLHSTPANWQEKLLAAFDAGCRRFDGALGGIGGCPMAGDDLVGNMNMINMIDFFKERNLAGNINAEELNHCRILAEQIFK